MSNTASTPVPRPTRARRGDISEGLLAALLLAPAALVLGAVLLYPLLTTIWSSLFVQKLTEPWLGNPFVGLQQYQQMLQDRHFLNALRNTLVFALFTVTGSFLVGIPMALVAHWESRWRGLARAAMLLPWAMPPVFTALIFAWIFNGQYGVVNDWLVRLGFEPVLWLTQPLGAIFALIVTIVWKTSSFVALIVLGGLMGVPKELTEAAQVDGANRWYTFWKVIMPLLAPALAVAMIFRTISALQLFDIPYAMTAGGPAGVTETLGIYIFRTTIQYLDFGYGAALSVALFALSLGVTLIYVRFVRGDQ